MVKTVQEMVEELMKRVEANDAASICLLAECYHKGLNSVQQDRTKAIELFTRAADLGNLRRIAFWPTFMMKWEF
jgi:TPR repeat protein